MQLKDSITPCFLAGRRFCFHLRLEPEVASFAKFASYHISAPSQEAKMVWMHAVQLASFSRPFLLEGDREGDKSVHEAQRGDDADFCRC
uniref:PH domain-containing protein n=1 Tax=Physcomitrium patens TaxID=3218 RepID=A0A7I4EHN0_PHYPA